MCLGWRWAFNGKKKDYIKIAVISLALLLLPLSVEAAGTVNDSSGFNWTVFNYGGAAVNDSGGSNWTVYTKGGTAVNDSSGFNWTVSSSFIAATHESPASPSTAEVSKGGGAGGGGGTVGGTPGGTNTIIVGDIKAGQTKTITDIGEKTGIAQITIEISQTVADAKLEVTVLASAPSTATAPEGSVYKYLDMKIPQITGESIITKAEIKFKVEKQWLSDNDLDKNSVVLARLNEGSWQKLVTDFSSEDGTLVYYTSQTPGFSTFAILAERLVTGGPAMGAAPEEAPTILGGIIPQIEEPAAKTTTKTATTLIAILVLIGVAYFMLTKKEKKRKRAR